MSFYTKKRKFQWKDLICIDTALAILFFGTLIYFIYKAKKKTYPFLVKKDELKCDRIKIKKTNLTGGTSKIESFVGLILKDLFPNHKFDKIRPKWLKNPATNKCLEIDFFNPDIKTPLGKGMGFEVDGAQHAMFSPFFHKSKMDFMYQVKKDEYKDKKCKKKGILLIRIPHHVLKVNMRQYIRDALKIKGFVLD